MELFHELLNLGGEISTNSLHADITYNNITYGFTDKTLSYILVPDDNTSILHSPVFRNHDNLKYYISENHVVIIGRKVFMHKDNINKPHLKTLIDVMRDKYAKSSVKYLLAVDERDLINNEFRLLVRLK